MAVRVSEVTDVDRRAGRRLGMDPEKVNQVINTWADEYLKVERERDVLTKAANPPAAPRKRQSPKVKDQPASPPPAAFSHPEQQPGTETPTETTEGEKTNSE